MSTDPATPSSPHDIPALRALAEGLAREAGALARLRRAEGIEVAATKSSIVDVVTHADREVEALIRARLAELRPEDAFFGEESGSGTGSSGLTWVVDPIDGTVNYLYGLPNYAVSIAVVDGPVDPERWSVLAGVVYQPELDRLASAGLGLGATLDGRPVHVSAPASLAETLFGSGFSYDADLRALQARILAGMVGEIRDLRRFGSAALDLVASASGLLDAYGEAMLNPWDIAAGVLLVTEAGGVVEYLDSGTPLGSIVLTGSAEAVRGVRALMLRAIALATASGDSE